MALSTNALLDIGSDRPAEQVPCSLGLGRGIAEAVLIKASKNSKAAAFVPIVGLDITLAMFHLSFFASHNGVV